MNWASWLLWGFVATLVLTTIMAGAQGLRLTRMSLPYMLGAMFTPSRDRAKLIGFGAHVLNGWLFSLLYVAAFHEWGRATWWLPVIILLPRPASRFWRRAAMRSTPELRPVLRSVSCSRNT